MALVVPAFLQHGRGGVGGAGTLAHAQSLPRFLFLEKRGGKCPLCTPLATPLTE